MRGDEKVLEERLRTMARWDNPSEVREALSGVRPEDIAEAFLRLDLEEGLHLLRHMDPETAAYVLIEVPTEAARQYLNGLPDSIVAHYLDILPMDDAVELREELDPERFEALLRVIPNEDAQEIRRLLSYPDESVGQLMTEDFVAVSPEATMDDVLAVIRQTADRFETVNYIYVLGADRHLLGVLTLRRVIRSAARDRAREVMNDDPISVSVAADQEEAARMIARYGFSAVPVLDERGRMVGIVTADDAQEVLEDAETEDVLKMGAVSGDAEAYLSLSVWELVKRRVPWLLGLFVAESLTGNVLRAYGQGGGNDEIKLNPLTFFIPLLIGAGGNSGAQVTTTITRALALNEVRPADWWRVLRREMATSVISGTILGLVGFARAVLPIPVIGWGSSLDLSIVVGASLPAIIIWSTTVGSLLPIAAKRMGVDPAVMSAPFISTFVDATGLVIYFEIARRVLGHLGG